MVWDHEVAGSRPVTPTKKKVDILSTFFIYSYEGDNNV